MATRFPNDVTELIRPSLSSACHDFRKKNLGVFEAKYLWTYLSIRKMVYINRIVLSGEFFKKNDDEVVCTLINELMHHYCNSFIHLFILCSIQAVPELLRIIISRCTTSSDSRYIHAFRSNF